MEEGWCLASKTKQITAITKEIRVVLWTIFLSLGIIFLSKAKYTFVSALVPYLWTHKAYILKRFLSKFCCFLSLEKELLTFVKLFLTYGILSERIQHLGKASEHQK